MHGNKNDPFLSLCNIINRFSPQLYQSIPQLLVPKIVIDGIKEDFLKLTSRRLDMYSIFNCDDESIKILNLYLTNQHIKYRRHPLFHSNTSEEFFELWQFYLKPQLHGKYFDVYSLCSFLFYNDLETLYKEKIISQLNKYFIPNLYKIIIGYLN